MASRLRRQTRNPNVALLTRFASSRGGIRTHTPLRAGDFKSPASAIPPLGHTRTPASPRRSPGCPDRAGTPNLISGYVLTAPCHSGRRIIGGLPTFTKEKSIGPLSRSCEPMSGRSRRGSFRSQDTSAAPGLPQTNTISINEREFDKCFREKDLMCPVGKGGSYGVSCAEFLPVCVVRLRPEAPNQGTRTELGSGAPDAVGSQSSSSS